MKLSWSQKLFLKINEQTGVRRWLDVVMVFFAQYLIYFLIFLVLAWGLVVLPPVEFKLFIKLILTSSAVALAVSWLGALIFKNPRPVMDFPEIKELIRPLQVFKSFPSDHTMMSFIFYLLAVLAGAGWFWIFFFFICANLVALGRIYVGVHYPRDVVGGMLYALVFVLVSSWLLGNFTQPVYVWLINLL